MLRSTPGSRAAALLALPVALALLAAVAAAEAGPGPRPAGVRIGVASPLEKLRPGDEPPGLRGVDLAAAQGECESAQVAVRADRPLPALTATAAPLDGPGRLPVSLYRVVALPPLPPSGPDGAAGEWPDPLVPERDAWYGEPRHAFPVEVPAGRLQAVWVEVCVPPGAAPGEYRGEVRLADGEAPLGAAPVRLTVWPFALPATPPATAGLATRRATAALGAPGDPELARALAASLLRHGLSPYGLSYDPPAGACTAAACALDWTAYDRELGPLLDGALVPGRPAAFADARVPRRAWEGPPADLVALLSAWRRHFEARGWGDRLWVYTLDEAKPAQQPELARRAALARLAGVRVLATVRPSAPLAGLAGAFAPNLTAFEDGGEAIHAAQRDAGGPGPWWYASCLSHACAEPPASGWPASWRRGHAGWPGYEIDRPGAAARAMGWLAFRAGVAGELYYDAVAAWDRDPWSDPRRFAGNGDGTLLYPGLPARLGGGHPFPVESIRLKLIRDGLEDWSLLLLARRLGAGAEAGRLAAEVAPSLRGFARDAAPWERAHRRLGDLVARTLAAGAAAGPAP